MLSVLMVEWVKVVVNIDKGCYVFNVVNGVVLVNEMSLEGFELWLEVIDF